MGGGAEFGHCTDKLKDTCFAYVNGRCRILHNCDFKGKECPFYKSKEDYEDGRKEKRR